MRSSPVVRPRVLSIAGSDSGGGAGIQADIKVITCLGGYPMTAVTAVTAQDTRGVHGIHPVPPEFVARQIDLCFSDIGVDGVKTGMLCGAPTVHSVAAVLKRRRAFRLVVDPEGRPASAGPGQKGQIEEKEDRREPSRSHGRHDDPPGPLGQACVVHLQPWAFR